MEVQVSFVVILLREGKAKITMVLCGISILDTTFSQVSTPLSVIQRYSLFHQDAMMKRIAQRFRLTDKTKAPLKRKVGYIDEHMSATRARLEGTRLGDMEIDGISPALEGNESK